MTRMNDYMMSIKSKVGYESLKAEYMRKFPVLNRDISKPIIIEHVEEENSPAVEPSNVSLAKKFPSGY